MITEATLKEVQLSLNKLSAEIVDDTQLLSADDLSFFEQIKEGYDVFIYVALHKLNKQNK